MAKNSRFCFGKVIASSYHFSTKFLIIGVDSQLIHAIALERFMTNAQIVHYEFELGDPSLKTLSPKKQERNFILNHEEYFHTLFDNKVGNSRVLKKQEN